MLWCWIVFGILVCLAFAEQFAGLAGKSVETVCLIIVVFLIFMSTIRWNQYNGDWNSYLTVFNSNPPQNFIDIFRYRQVYSFEPLVYYFFRFVKYTTDNYIIVQFVMAVLSVGVFYVVSRYLNRPSEYRQRKYSYGRSSLACMLLLSWTTDSMGIYAIRSTMAYAICLYSIRYVEKKDLKRFAFCILIATMIHFSSIVFIPVFFLYHKKINIKTYLFAVLGIVAVKIIGLSRILSLVRLLGGRYAHKIDGYNYQLETSYFSAFNFSYVFVIGKALANTILVVLLCVYFLHYEKHRNGNNCRMNGLVNIYLVGAILQVLLLPYNLRISRVSVPFIQCQYFIIPYILSSTNNRRNRYIYFAIIILYAILRMYVLMHMNDSYSTYNTIFSM